MNTAPHHRSDGRFRNPWPMAGGDDALRRRIWRVAAEWALGRHPPDPEPGDLPVATPDVAYPSLPVPGNEGGGEIRVTWIGHATALIQLPGLNVLTDPVWSDRSSPVGFAGPRRFVPPGLALDALPPIHAVLLSHDHYDHLDEPTVRALHRRFGNEVAWFTPLGYRDWFAARGVGGVVERDWWEAGVLPGGRFTAVCVPARHWTRRRVGGTNRRLWAGWVVVPTGEDVAGAKGPDDDRSRPGPRVYFLGDSGYCPAFREVGDRLGPFDLTLAPIGAYDPRWFMAAAHMNPEEAVAAYRDAGGAGAFLGIHWGTWRLTFEDPLEPPRRARAAWSEAGLPAGELHLPRHGETRILPVRGL